MKTENIKRLLELYYEGKTTIHEEELLTKYFGSYDVAPELIDEKFVFQSIHSTAPIDINEDLENKLNILIDNLEKSESSNNLHITYKQKKKKKVIYWISGVAASIAILLSIGILYNDVHYGSNSPQLVLRDTYTDPNQAYAETEKALLLISSKLNKGLSGIETFEEGLEKSNAIIDKNFKQIK